MVGSFFIYQESAFLIYKKCSVQDAHCGCKTYISYRYKREYLKEIVQNVSTPEQAAKMCQSADGAIVGSAIVKLCEKYGKDCVPYVAEYVKSMVEACK